MNRDVQIEMSDKLHQANKHDGPQDSGSAHRQQKNSCISSHHCEKSRSAGTDMPSRLRPELIAEIRKPGNYEKKSKAKPGNEPRRAISDHPGSPALRTGHRVPITLANHSGRAGAVASIACPRQIYPPSSSHFKCSHNPHSPSGVSPAATIARIFLRDKRFLPERRLRSRSRLELGGSDREAAACLSTGGVFQCGRQTCPTALVQFGRGSRSCGAA